MKLAERGPCAALALVVAFAATSACGGRAPPPERRVIEGDVAAWSFRRYQQLVDIEVWIPNNRAVAHTASYARTRSLKRGHLSDEDVANVFVTEYEADRGVLRALARFARRLAQEAGYVVEERRLGGVRVISVVGHGEAWALWSAGRFLVKIGGRRRGAVPAALVQAYGGPYPSSLRAGVLEGPLPEGEDAPAEPAPEEPYDPKNPRPDWDHDARDRGGREAPR